MLMAVANLIILSFAFVPNGYARNLFSDNFSSGNLTSWVENTGNVGATGSWFISGGELHSIANKGQHSFLCAKTENELPPSYTMTADVKNISGVDQQFIFKVSGDYKNYYLVDYRYDGQWEWDNNDIRVYRIFDGGFRQFGRYSGGDVLEGINVSQGVDHKIKIEIGDQNINVYFDNILVIEAKDENSDYLVSGSFCLMTWGGEFGSLSENVYKKVELFDATSVERNKIIILPGLGASWNPEAILLGSSDSSLKWSMTPFVRNYNLLIETLKSNSLIENEDFYVWNYDWRKPLSQIVTDFNSFVQSLNLGSNEKIDLVGHSLGGLVARLWTQDHSQLVGKAITLGSPHYGSLKAYEAWNAAKFGDNLDISTIALNVLLQLQKKNGDNSITALRRFSPIVFDLSPTFNFLKKNGVEVLAEKSEYLVEKNNSISAISNSLSTIDGLGVETKEWINIGDRNVVDKLLGIWSEGRPISYDFADGDGTVLKKSALIPGSENVDFNSNHGALVDISTNWIMSKLGLGITTSGNTSYPDKGLTFYLGSPASMQVKCGEIVKNDDRGWVIIENKEIGNCGVTLTGKDEGGIYHLVVGRGDEWKYFEGEIKKDEKINFLVNQIEDSWQILKRDFKEIGASRALKAAEKKNILETTAYYMTYRLVKDDFRFSEEILKNLEIILGGKKTSKYENKMMYQRAKQQYKLAKARIELMTKKGMKLSYSLAINFAEAESLMGLESDYAGNYLAEKLLIISWMK